MQIHELTQKRTQVDEGVADIARAASDKLSSAGYAAGGLKRGLAGIKSAWQQGKVATQSRKLADQSQDVWSRYVQNWEATMDPDEKAKFDTRKGDIYKRQLTAWVQKNMLSDLTLANVTNRNEILSIINQLSQPRQISPVKEADTSDGGIVIPAGAKTAAAPPPSKAAPTKPTATPGMTPSEEKRLWLKLAQEVGRAQQAAYTGEREAQAQAAATTTAAQTNTAPQGDMTREVKQQLAKAGQDKNLGVIGKLIQPLAQTSSVNSTGNVAVDSLLRNMGFTVS